MQMNKIFVAVIVLMVVFPEIILWAPSRMR